MDCQSSTAECSWALAQIWRDCTSCFWSSFTPHLPRTCCFPWCRHTPISVYWQNIFFPYLISKYSWGCKKWGTKTPLGWRLGYDLFIFVTTEQSETLNFKAVLYSVIFGIWPLILINFAMCNHSPWKCSHLQGASNYPAMIIEEPVKDRILNSRCLVHSSAPTFIESYTDILEVKFHIHFSFRWFSINMAVLQNILHNFRHVIH